MKKSLKLFTVVALALSCSVAAVACETTSNLKKEGWEEIVKYAKELSSYKVMLTTEQSGQDLITQTYSADLVRAEPRITYNKVGNEAGTIADEYILMDDEEETFRYSLEYNADVEMWRTVKRNVTPVEGEKNSAFVAFQRAYDLRVNMLGVIYYPEGKSDGVDFEGLYESLTYSRGTWKGEMAFNLSDTLYTGSVEVEYMPDNIDSFHANKNGLLFRIVLKTSAEGVSFKWTYDIQSWNSGFISNPPTNAEFVE